MIPHGWATFCARHCSFLQVLGDFSDFLQGKNLRKAPTFGGAAQHCLNVHMYTEASNFGFKQLYFHLVLLALHPKNSLKIKNE